jgi:TM2 domain-containing membrane protein YozV
MFCNHCGAEIPDKAVICIKCGVPSSPGGNLEKSSKSRLAYILLGLFLGGWGIHNFYAGRTGKGVAQLLITLVSIPLLFVVVGFFGLLAIFIWVIIEVCTVTKDAQGKQLS